MLPERIQDTLPPKLQRDFVGHISKMCHSISFGVSSTKVSSKLCPKYRLHLHLLLRRDLPDILHDKEDLE